MVTNKKAMVIVRSQTPIIPIQIRSFLETHFQGKAEFFNSTKQYQFLIRFNPGVFLEEIDAIRELETLIDSIVEHEPETNELQELRHAIEGTYFLEIESSTFKIEEWPTFN